MSDQTRREFLVNSGKTGLVAATVGAPALVQADEMPDEQALKQYFCFLENERAWLCHLYDLTPLAPKWSSGAAHLWLMEGHRGMHARPETRALPILRLSGMDRNEKGAMERCCELPPVTGEG